MRRTKNTKNKSDSAVYTGCDGCVHWRDCGCGMKACHLTADTGRVRDIPHSKCYKHNGTGYEEILK